VCPGQHGVAPTWIGKLMGGAGETHQKRGKPMENPWKTHGKPVENPWKTHGKPTVSLGKMI